MQKLHLTLIEKPKSYKEDKDVVAFTIDDINFDQDYGINRVTKTLTKNKVGKTIVGSVPKNKNDFGYLSQYMQQKNKSSSSQAYNVIMGILFFIILVSSFIAPFSGGYYGHRGFYGGYHRSHWGGRCVHSSCASSCACACAGSGRAGCSKKDFYGTKISKEKWKKVMK